MISMSERLIFKIFVGMISELSIRLDRLRRDVWFRSIENIDSTVK